MSVPDYMMQRERPIGISILSVLHFIGGIGCLGLAVFALLWLRDPKLVENMAAVGIPIPLFIAGIVFLAILSLASSVGMWNGDRWGWYLGSFWYAYAIVRNVSALLSVDDVFRAFPPQPGTMAHGISFYYTKFAIRLVISVLIYLYFFKNNVREYFGLLESKRWIAIAIQFFLCIDIILAAFAWFKYAH